MKVIRGLQSIGPTFDRSVLSIGNFDGVHRGHQQLLAQGALFAAQMNAPLVVLTFDPHPISILRPGHAPPTLMRLADKLNTLSAHNVDVTIVADSTPELLGLTPERFIDVLVDKLHPTHIVEGSTFGFGRGRKGNPETLRASGMRFGFDTCIIDPVRLTFSTNETLTVSSSVIRRLLHEHEVHRAALALGRPYFIVGEIIEGAGRGRSLGFPTANVHGIETLVPAEGVYAGTARVGDRTSLAAISIGTNPTFHGRTRKVEAHLLDGAGDIVGQFIHVEFARWLRPQRTFDSGAELAAQIAEDVRAVRHHTDPAHSPAARVQISTACTPNGEPGR